MNMRRVTVLGTLSIVVALIVVACGGGDDATATPRSQQQPTAVPPTATTAPTGAGPTARPQATPTATPRPTLPPSTVIKRGGTLRLPQFHDLITPDPSNTGLYQTFYLMADFVWNGLVRFDNKRWSDFDVVGDLATEWDVSADGTSVTFKLDPAATWQSIEPTEGRAFVAADVKFYLDTVRDPAFGSGLAGILQDIDTIAAPDDQTVVFTLKQPFFGFVNALANPRVVIQSKDVFDENGGNWGANPVGTGPFIFDRHERAARVVHTANPTYWKMGADGSPLPYIDEVELIIGAFGEAVTAGLRTGQFAFATPGGLDPIIALPLREETGDQFTWIIDNKLYAPTIFGNLAKEPWKSNKKLRQALLKALDQDAFRSNVLFEEDAPWEGPITSGMGEFSLPQDELKTLLSRDLAGAKRLLAEAGYGPDNPISFDLQFMLPGPPGSQTERYIQVIGPMLQEAGFDVTVKNPASAAEGYGAVLTGRFDVGSGFVGFEGDIFNWWRSIYQTKGVTNRAGLSDPVLDKMIVDFGQIPDAQQRVQAAHDLQRYLLDQAYIIPLTAGRMYIPQQSYIKGFGRTWGWGFSGIENIWFDL